MYKCTLSIFLMHLISTCKHTDKPITLQRDNVYENVNKIIKMYDCKYRINNSGSNCVRF